MKLLLTWGNAIITLENSNKRTSLKYLVKSNLTQNGIPEEQDWLGAGGTVSARQWGSASLRSVKFMQQEWGPLFASPVWGCRNLWIPTKPRNESLSGGLLLWGVESESAPRMGPKARDLNRNRTKVITAATLQHGRSDAGPESPEYFHTLEVPSKSGLSRSRERKTFEWIIPTKGNGWGGLTLGLTSQTFPVRLPNVVDPGCLTITRIVYFQEQTRKVTSHFAHSLLFLFVVPFLWEHLILRRGGRENVDDF